MQIVWSSGREPDLNDALGNWCAAQIGLPRGFRDHSCMGVFEDGKPIAVMVYSNFQSEAGVVEIHGAATTPRWLNRKTLWEMFSYPFNELKCQTVVMRCDPEDNRLARILTSYGFTSITLPRMRGRDKDEIIYILHDDIWMKNGFHHQNKIKETG